MSSKINDSKVYYSAIILFLCLSNSLFSQSLDYKTVKFELTFTTDWGAVEVYAGYYKNLDHPRGFRESGMKLTFNGSLSQFAVTTNRIQVTKYDQYDGTPVKLTILYDLHKDWNMLNIYTNQGGFGSIKGEIFDLTGKKLGEFSDTGGRRWENWKFTELQFSPSGIYQSSSHTLHNYHLNQNFPNPFNSSTTIKYSVAENGSVVLKVYNELGQLVKILINESQPVGDYLIQWDGLDENGNNAPSGTYFYKLYNGKNEVSQKMLLLR